MRKTYTERWKNNKGEREDHYFVSKTKKRYIFGVNPKFVTPKQVKEIMEIIGIK